MKGTQMFYVFITASLINNQIVVASRKSCKGKTPDLAGCHCMPICGSDNYTYTDECFLKAYNKSCGKDTKVKSWRPCNGKVKLPPVTSCYPGNGLCTRDTEENHPKIYDPVCSTDGKMFGNACDFHYQRKLNGSIEFAQCGEC